MSSPIGSSVCVRGERWVVVGCDRFDACSVFVLEGSDRQNAGQRRRLIEPFDRLRSLDHQRLRRRKRNTVLRAALEATTHERPVGGLWTAASARITLLPYQLEPALAALDGATRILLADDVGLGKTIQAGLILSELRARSLVDRVLILTPAGLRETWATELRDRFGLESLVLDQASVAARTAALPPDVNPWTLEGITIASLDFAKRPEVLANVEQAPWDLVIADAAHHLTPGSDRGAAVERLAARTPWVVLVSATPHSGDEAAFHYLSALGALDDRLQVFRRSRTDLGTTVRRREHLFAIDPHPAEREMLQGTERYARAIWRGRGAGDRGARLVATTLARRAASSSTALHRTLTRRLALMSGAADPLPQPQQLPWDDVDTSDDDDATWLGCAGLDDATEERRQIEALIRLSQEAEPFASKTRRLLRLLDRAREPVVIFTEYRDTLEALATQMESSQSVALIHGGLAPVMRQDAVARFTRGDVDALIATDAAGEGLNLHQRCRLVINIELPWNPLRLAQRVGRVDRIGQSRRVHAVHLYHRNSIEDLVLARLERRRLSAGAWMSVDDIAATALGSSPVATRDAPRIMTSCVARAGAEASRAEEQRRVRALIPNSVNADGCWAPPHRPAHGTSQVILLHLVRQLDGDLRVIDEHCMPILAAMGVSPRNQQQWRSAIEALSRDARILSQCKLGNEPLRVVVEGAVRRLATAMVPRIERIRQSLTQVPVSMRQVSLFDRRSEDEAESRRRVRATLDAHLARRVDQLSGLTANARRSTVRLVAAWAARALA